MSYNPKNPNGQATSANSEPVVIASDQSAVPVSAGSLPLPAGAATAANQATANTSLATIATNTGNIPASPATSTKQSDGSQKTQLVDGSGNVIGATSNALDVNIKSNAGTDTVTGNIASGVADSGNPVKVGAKYNSAQPTFTDGQRGDLQIGSRGALRVELWNASGSVGMSGTTPSADGQATSTGSLGTIGFGHVFNGTTWDRVRSSSAIVNTTVDTGLPGVHTLVYDTTTGKYQRLNMASADAMANLSGPAAAGTMTYNGTTWDRNRSATSVAGTTGTGVPAAGVLGFDGTNYQRLKTDTSGQLIISASTVGTSDGTTTGSVVAGDAGQNAQVTAGARKEVVWTGTALGAYASTDVSNYAWVSVQVSTPASGENITFQVSNDNSNWISSALALANTTNGAPTTTTGTNTVGIWHGPIAARYFRLNRSGSGGSTVAGTVEFFASAHGMQSMGSTVGGGTSDAADAVATTAGAIRTISDTLVFNGTTFDRVRSDGTTGGVATGGSVASGAADSGNPVKVGGKYNSTRPTLTDGQRGDLQLTSRGDVIVQVFGSDDSGPVTSVQTSDALAAGTRGMAALSLGSVYNGTTWDRVRSDGTTGGVATGGSVASGSADSGNPVKVGAKYNATKPTFTDGQRGDLQIGTRGSLGTTLYQADSATSATISTALSDGSSAFSGLVSLGYPMLFNGTTWDRMRSGGVTGMAGVSGDTAAAASDAGNPVKIGGVGKTANPTAVTDGQRANALFDKLGKQVVVPAIRDLVGDQQTQINTTTTATTVVTAVASTFCDLVSLTLANTSSTGSEVQLLNDDGTTVRWVGYVPANDTRGIVFQVPFTQAAVNSTWKIKTVTAIASLKVTAQFVKNI